MKINTKKYLALYNIEDYVFKVIGRKARKRGCLTFNEFYCIGMWKSARQKPNYLKNKKLVKFLTKEAFKQPDEKKKITSLLIMRGVGIPTASALLTVVYPDKYAIIDIRCVEMLKKLGFKLKSSMTLKNWLNYLQITRDLAKENNITPRELDKVLFAMHKESLEKSNYRNLYI